jgi:branched-chain amino acid aminotransferase
LSLRRNDRVAYHNGRYMPESEVAIPLRDRGFLYGDAVFDTTRTFAHKPFRLEEHVARLYRSLAYVGIDPGLRPAELVATSEEVLRRNRHLMAEDEDCWLSQRVTRGPKQGTGIDADGSGPTVIVECLPLPLAERAVHYRDGIRVVTPVMRRTPPEAVSPRAKTHNYLNLVQQVSALDPGAWAVLLDTGGSLAEGLGSNIFLVRDGELLTPRERQVLPGISRRMVIELAGGLGLPVREVDLDLFDASIADEAFLTSTSLCICPVASINGRHVGPEGQIYGPITRKLINAYSTAVGCDFVSQYLRRLEA